MNILDPFEKRAESNIVDPLEKGSAAQPKSSWKDSAKRILDSLAGQVEGPLGVASQFTTGAIGQSLSGLAGIGKLITSGGDLNAANQAVQSGLQDTDKYLTYHPISKTGEDISSIPGTVLGAYNETPKFVNSLAEKYGLPHVTDEMVNKHPNIAAAADAAWQTLPIVLPIAKGIAKGLTVKGAAEAIPAMGEGLHDTSTFSVSRSDLPPEVNGTATAAAEKTLAASGVPYKKVNGYYGGEPETSFVVPNHPRAIEVASKLAKDSNQESILHTDAEGKAKLVYSDGKVEELPGTIKEVSSEVAKGSDGYTHDPATDKYYTNVPDTSSKIVDPLESVSKLPLNDEGRVEVAHYSNQPDLSELDPSKHGTGISGAEKRRKLNDPANWENRTYFGVESGATPYAKEEGLGPHKYVSSFDPGELYDLAKDPDGLLPQAKEGLSTNINLYEKLIKDAGYKGFFRDDPQIGTVVAAFDKTKVETPKITDPNTYETPSLAVQEAPKGSDAGVSIGADNGGVSGPLNSVFSDNTNDPMSPGPGAKATGVRQTPPDLEQLRTTIADMSTPKTSFMEKVQLGKRLAETFSGAKDSVGRAVDGMRGVAAAMHDAYVNPPKWTEFKDMLGKRLGARQVSAFHADAFAKDINTKVPKNIQEAITNYIEAGGDKQLLKERVNLLKKGPEIPPDVLERGLSEPGVIEMWELKRDRQLEINKKMLAGYEDALRLSPEHVVLAANIRNYFDSRLEAAHKAGMLQNGVENYINHIWDRDPKVAKRLMAEANAGLLDTNPSLVKKRIFSSFFDGEQAGGKPLNKQAGFLVTAYDQAFNEAVEARSFIKSAHEGNATDGRPLVSVSGGGTPLPKGEAPAEVYLIKPRVKPENTGDYRALEHPSLQKWIWVAKDSEGKPIMLQGDMLVHPEIYQHMKNMLGKSAIRDYAVGRGVLDTSQTLKGTLLSLSGFHQVQEGVHAVFHRVNPANVPKINMEHPETRALIDHGLMVYEHNALANFGEGLHTGGLIGKVPGIGDMMQKYGDYLFKDYIPRIKTKMALDALERNTQRYAGKYTPDQIMELTAKQANAAFGELNYNMMGRNKTAQDVFRLAALAPDFLEARLKFVGQSFKPGGAEQATALIRGALGMYTVARAINAVVNDGDAHWELKNAFSLVIGGKSYSLRSIPGDILHLAKDWRSFIYHRLNPMTARNVFEGLTGRDEFGRKRDAVSQLGDSLVGVAPIPIQSSIRKGAESVMGREFTSDAKLLDSLLQSLGVSRKEYRTDAEDKAKELMMAGLPDKAFTTEDRQRNRLLGKLSEDLKGKVEGADTAASFAFTHGQISREQYKTLYKDMDSTKLDKYTKHLTLEELQTVLKEATPTEKKLLEPIYNRKLRSSLHSWPGKQE